MDTETLTYLWTSDLDPLFWREGRADVPSAWYGHIPFAHWIVAVHKPRVVVELGTENGVSYSAFCEAVVQNGLDTRCFAVDTWLGDVHSGHYGEEVYLDLRRYHDGRYAAFSELLRCTFDEALPYIPDASVDLLHIDGLHTYEAVRHDFEDWRPKLSESAVVLFHDTNVREREFGVWRLWQELQTQYPSFEFLHGHGLGVLAVGQSVSPQVAALCSLADPACVSAIRQRFSLLGERWVLFYQNRAQRTAAESELRARAALRTAHARAEAANAMAQAAEAKRRAATAPLVVPSATVLPQEADKQDTVDNLSRELANFLASSQRLSFPAHKAPDVSVIVVLFNQAQFTLQCLRALLSQTEVTTEIILVDNNSTDETTQLVAKLDNVRVLRNRENTGFLVAVNQGAAEARGRTILLLNSDAFLREHALPIALSVLDSEANVGAVGGRLILPAAVLQEAGSIIWSDASTQGYGRGLAPEAPEAMFRRDVDYCSGAFLLTPRAVFERLGGLDRFYAPAYYEEADYCLRLWEAGHRVVYEPRVVIDHYEFGSETRRGDATELNLRNRKRLRFRHAETLRLRHLPSSKANLLFARDHARQRGRLLVIENEVPFRALGSGYPRMGVLLNEAVAAGWFVTLYPLRSDEIDWEAAYRELSAEIEICGGKCAAGLAEFLHERQGYYDVMLVSRPDNMALFQETTQQQPHLISGARLIYDAEALFAARTIAKAEVEGQPMSAGEADALIKREMALTAGVDAIVTVTIGEAQIFGARQKAPVYVLGYPVQVMRDTPDFLARTGFLFVGRLLEKQTPNYEGLSWFIHLVWPRVREALGEVTLTICGALHPESTEFAAPGVLLLGRVEDLQALYARTRIFVAPIRFAAGVPIKVLDAGGAGLPVVSTKLMATQLGWEPGLEIEAYDDPAEMADAAIALYRDPTRWHARRSAAFDKVSAERTQTAFRRELRALLDAADPLAGRDTGQVSCGS